MLPYNRQRGMCDPVKILPTKFIVKQKDSLLFYFFKQHYVAAEIFFLFLIYLYRLYHVVFCKLRNVVVADHIAIYISP